MRILPRACALALLAASAYATPDLPLPRWEDDLPASADSLGAAFNDLLPPPPASDEAALHTGPRLAESLSIGVGDLSPADLALFLRGASESPEAPARRGPTPAAALREAPWQRLAVAGQASPAEYLLDPQNLVPEFPREDLRRLLEFHGSEARIRLYFLILDTDQKLPAAAPLHTLAQGTLARGHTCLVVYPLGEPWRARLLVSREINAVVPLRDLAELAEDCLQDSLSSDDQEQQLQRYAIRLSTRLFGLEKLLPPDTRPAPDEETTGVRLHEVGSEDEARAASPAAPSRKLAGWLRVTAWGVAGILIGAGGVGAAMWQTSRRRHRLRLSHAWLLPDEPAAARLGGNFSGGTCAVLKYR